MGCAPPDRPGRENKVTFSAQQPDCLIVLGSRGMCGGSQPPPLPPARCLFDQIVPGHNKEGLKLFSFRVWKLIYVVKISAGSEEEQKKH